MAKEFQKLGADAALVYSALAGAAAAAVPGTFGVLAVSLEGESLVAFVGPVVSAPATRPAVPLAPVAPAVATSPSVLGVVEGADLSHIRFKDVYRTTR